MDQSGLSYQWKLVSDKIKSLESAAQVFAAVTTIRGQDSTGADDSLTLAANDVVGDLREIQTRFATQLPPEATRALTEFTAYHEKLKGARRSGTVLLAALLALLSTARIRLDFALARSDQHLRRLVERAFLHLRRSLVVDEVLHDRWERAFKDTARTEVLCEALGAVHLLGHGIWAFKAHADGGRTDLVLGEKLAADAVRGVADALTLTEWKVVRRECDLDERVAQALEQAKKYSEGALAGVELRTIRYLVTVSEKDMVLKSPRQDGGVTYLHVNIAISPANPSKA